MRFAHFVLWILFFLSGAAGAADNPLGAGRPDAVNPLGAPADPLAGNYVGDTFSLSLKNAGGGKYGGVIRMGAKEFPVTASGNGQALKGSFLTDGQSFEFTALLEGQTLTLSTGGATHTLRREAANPLAMLGGDHAAPLPAGETGKLEVLQSTQTGQTLFEARSGARSAKALLPQAVSDLAAYLGVRPTIAGAFADVKDLRGGASFTAKMRDRAIKGMILVGIGEKGGAITVVFDSADAPQRNLAALAAAAQPQAEPKWDDARLPDGSGTMKLPTGWRITGAANGAVDVVGPEGQSIELGLAYPVVTPEADRAFKQQQIALGIRPAPSVVPVAAFPADPARALEEMVPVFSRLAESAGGAPISLVKVVETSPVQGGNSAFVHAILAVGKGNSPARYHSIALVSFAQTGIGQWLYYTSYVTAPEATFARDLPVMLKIWSTWKVSDAVLQARLQKAMGDMKEAGESVKRSGANASKVRDNANADFDEVIRGYRTVEDTQTGERREVDLGWSTKIVEKMNEKEGYDRYKEIPLRDQ